MLIIVEGIDRVGKTTLCNLLNKKLGFRVFKDVWTADEYDSEVSDTTSYAIGKFESTLTCFKLFLDDNEGLVCDRLHFTEYVYGALDRHGLSEDYILNYDMLIEHLFHPLLIWVKSENMEQSCHEAEKDLRAHEALFGQMYDSTFIKNKIITSYSNLCEVVQKIHDGEYSKC